MFFAYAAETKFTAGDRLLLIYDDRNGDTSGDQLSSSVVEWVAGGQYSNDQLEAVFDKNDNWDELPDEDSFDVDLDPWFVDEDGIVYINLHFGNHSFVINDEVLTIPDEIRHLGEDEPGIITADLVPVPLEELQEGDTVVFASFHLRTLEETTFTAYDKATLEELGYIYLAAESFNREFPTVTISGKRP